MRILVTTRIEAIQLTPARVLDIRTFVAVARMRPLIAYVPADSDTACDEKYIAC